MAQQLIDSLSAEFEPEKYKDEYRERVLDLIERKAAGEEIAVQPQAEEPEAAPDLMAALEASLAAMKDDGDSSSSSGSSSSSSSSGSSATSGKKTKGTSKTSNKKSAPRKKTAA
jgi:DNA end-binding protein Ku